MIAMILPVSRAYRFDAAVILAADAPGKLPAVKRLLAGSLVTMPKNTLGTCVTLFTQMSYCVNEPPRLMLCSPLSQVTVSSTSRLLALRDDGPGFGAGFVNCVLTVGNRSEKPC